MALEYEEKQNIISDFRINDKDTGSIEVQVALLSTRIRQLTEHLKTHPKDYHSSRVNEAGRQTTPVFELP